MMLLIENRDVDGFISRSTHQSKEIILTGTNKVTLADVDETRSLRLGGRIIGKVPTTLTTPNTSKKQW